MVLAFRHHNAGYKLGIAFFCMRKSPNEQFGLKPNCKPYPRHQNVNLCRMPRSMTCSQYLIHRVRNGTPPQRNAFFLRSPSTFQQKIPIFATQVPHVPSGSIAKERTNRKSVRPRLEGEVSPSAHKQLTDKHRETFDTTTSHQETARSNDATQTKTIEI